MFDIKGKSFIIVKHTYFESPGTPEAELVNFLRGHASSILYIRHPFPDASRIPLKTTVVEYTDCGDIKREIIAPLIPGNPVLFYIKDVIFSIYYVIKSGRIYDLYVGADNLNTFAGLILRAIGKVRNVAYYVIDFTPKRFQNRFLNAIYQALNKVCCYHADVILNVSDAMMYGREQIGIRKDLSAPQISVPLGCSFEKIPKKDISEVNPYTIVYFGMLREEHGPGLIIEALPFIVAQEPKVKVIFAGDGELKSDLIRRAEELGMISHVHFTGFIDSEEEVYRILTTSGLALATYPPGDDTYKQYSDPGKVKIYLACGLPIMITDVPPIAQKINARQAGVIVEYEPSCLARAVVEIFNDFNTYKHMRKRAIEMAAEFDWNTIWRRTFDSMDFNRGFSTLSL